MRGPASTGGVLAASALALWAPSALAGTGLEPGVHVDPGSPAAKEYALPLSQARGTGVAGSGSTLFGAGIGPRGPSGPAQSGSDRAAASGGKDAPTAVAARAPKASAPSAQEPFPAAALAAGARGSDGGDGSVLALAGGGVAVLILGGFGGTILRRARDSTDPA